MQVLKYKDGDFIPNGSKYIRSEYQVVGYEYAGHDLLSDIPIKELFHWYEVEED